MTSWLPTLISAPLDVIDERLAQLRTLDDNGGPTSVGVHLEGPFLGGAPGAHRAVADGPIDRPWLAGLPDDVALVTLAPERPGAEEAIRLLVERGVTVALGHTTASEAATERAVDAGASLFTHVFNASGAIHHRAPGALGVALTDDRLTISLIADGVHVAARMMRLAWRTKGPGRVALVTDATAWQAGRLAATGIELVDGAPRLDDGTLAGSALRLDGAVRHTVGEVGIDPVDAIAAVTAVPADVLGLTDRGRITRGRRADLVALSADLRVEQTWVGGRPQLGLSGS